MRTLEDLDRLYIALGANIPEHVKVSDLKKLAHSWIHYLRKQEKLHWEYVNNSIGENPTCVIPKGFNSEASLPSGYTAKIELIRKLFNLKEAKNERTR